MLREGRLHSAELVAVLDGVSEEHEFPRGEEDEEEGEEAGADVDQH